MNLCLTTYRLSDDLLVVDFCFGNARSDGRTPRYFYEILDAQSSDRSIIGQGNGVGVMDYDTAVALVKKHRGDYLKEKYRR